MRRNVEVHHGLVLVFVWPWRTARNRAEGRSVHRQDDCAVEGLLGLERVVSFGLPWQHEASVLQGSRSQPLGPSPFLVGDLHMSENQTQLLFVIRSTPHMVFFFNRTLNAERSWSQVFRLLQVFMDWSI